MSVPGSSPARVGESWDERRLVADGFENVYAELERLTVPETGLSTSMGCLTTSSATTWTFPLHQMSTSCGQRRPWSRWSANSGRSSSRGTTATKLEPPGSTASLVMEVSTPVWRADGSAHPTPPSDGRREAAGCRVAVRCWGPVPGSTGSTTEFDGANEDEATLDHFLLCGQAMIKREARRPAWTPPAGRSPSRAS